MIRVMLCLTQREFAARMNVASVSVSIWEVGKRTPRLETLFKMIKTFGLPMELFNDVINEKMEYRYFMP